ncbi:putative nucleoprotein [Soybean thrips rhabdo-like virus 1]|uniref:Nucleoprotein n=1 Tax=Soybean thrips rhabdo-like virus 1 TaxID=2802235 RepID=A0A7T8JIF5_9RHAB|nr:putative nucleoprotein [Soybean thrips rhabdo-like virus 1]
MDQLLTVKLGPGKFKKVEVPEISQDLQYQYPSEWFKKNPNCKPPILIPKSDLSNEDLGSLVSIVWTKGETFDEMFEFVVRYVQKNFIATLDEDWLSYGVTIGVKGKDITPLDLLDVSDRPYEPEKQKGTKLTSQGEAQKVCEILSLYRYQNASQSAGDYGQQILDRLGKVFKEPPFSVKELDSANISTNSSWGSTDNFRKLVAAIDMFFNKFPDHRFAKIKVATLSSRFRDCGGLSAIKFLTGLIGTSTTSEALKYVMDSRAGAEIVRLSNDRGEMILPNSYFPYFRDLALCPKSPYSSSANPAIYNFTYCLGTFLGRTRAFNARLFSDDGIRNSVNLAAYVAYYVGNWVKTEIVLESAEVLDMLNNKQSKDDEDDESEVHDHLFIYTAILKHNGSVPKEIKDQLKKEMERQKEMREGTIGFYIKSSF